MKNKIIIIILMLFFSIGFANQQHVKISEKSNRLDVTAKSFEGMTFNVELSEFSFFNVETKDGIYTQLLIPQFNRSQNIGEPSLPTMNKIIEIPYGAKIETKIISFREETFALTDLGIENILMPTQRSLSKSENVDDVPFQKDEVIYNENKFYSLNKINVKELGIMRYRNLALVQVFPVEYNPVTNEIKVYTEIEIEVNFVNADFTTTSQLNQNYYSPFFESAFNKVEKLDTKDDPGSLVRFPQKYVVVVPDEFVATMQPFIDWKTQQGFEVIVYNFASPANKDVVKNYLHDLYNDATEDDPAPTYILMVGDSDKLPPYDGTTGGHVTDLPFADVTGDMLPDMYIARFSARTEAELIPQVDKTLYYEKYEIEDPSYLNNISLIAGWDYSHTPSHGIPTIRYGEENYYNSVNGFNTTMYETSGSGQFEDEIIEDVNNGVALLNYTAHGSQTSWADPGMSISDVQGFTNAGKYTLAIGNACLTASFQVGECFGEAWIRQANKGAIGYIGGTNSTYWDEDVFWSTGYFNHVGDGVTPTFEETTMGGYDAAFTTDDLTTQSAMVYVGNFAVTTAASSLTDYYWEIYQLFGDPSLMIYWGEPSEMQVQHLPVLLIGNSTFEVNVANTPSALIGITKDGVLVGSAMTDINGDAIVDFGSPLEDPGEYKLTITALNKIPYVIDIPAIVPANVSIVPDTLPINSAGIVNVTVTDTANQAMQDVRVWISSPGYFQDTVLTDASGVAEINVNSPVGSFVEIFGKRVADSYLLFRDTIQITGGINFSEGMDLTVETEFGLVDTFSVNQPGMIIGGDIDGEVTVYIGANGNYETENQNYLTYLPTDKKDVSAYVVKNGYNTYTENFKVINAMSSVSGTVFSGTETIEGATVIMYRGGEEEYRTTTNYNGVFVAPNLVEVGDVSFEVKAFGFENYTEDYFVLYPSNDLVFTINRAASSYVSGYVQNTDGDYLDAEVKFFRFDNEELYKTLTTSTTQTGFFADTLVNFDFHVRVKSDGYKQIDTLISITEDAVLNFTMEIPSGILVLSADSKGYFADKERTIPINDISKIAKSSAEICDSLTAWGIQNTLEDPATSDMNTWVNYSAIFYVQGSSGSSIPTQIQAKLTEHVQNEGKLFVEGGELGYATRNDGFASEVLHFSDWTHDSSGDVKGNQVRHPLWNSPNALPSTFDVTYSVYGDQDALTAVNESERVGSWTSYTSDASIIAYNAHVVYFAFNFAKISDSQIKHDLLENAVKYLGLMPVVGVEDEIEILPTKYSLSQNYPNPFSAKGETGNPTTTIKFSIPPMVNGQSSMVSLKVYDVLGKEIAILVNEQKPSGNYVVTFDASKLTSGVYFYRISAGNFVDTKKMILLK